MAFLVELLLKILGQVWQTLSVNWPFLMASAVIAGALKVYVNQDRVAAFLLSTELKTAGYQPVDGKSYLQDVNIPAVRLFGMPRLVVPETFYIDKNGELMG